MSSDSGAEASPSDEVHAAARVPDPAEGEEAAAAEAAAATPCAERGEATGEDGAGARQPLLGLPGAGPDPDAARRRLVGRVVFSAGALGLPALLGAAAGYWVADRGTAWLPTFLGLLTSLGLVALLCMALGSYLLGPAVGRPRGRKRILASTSLLVLLAGGHVTLGLLEQPTPSTSLGRAEFGRAFLADARQAQDLDRTLGRAIAAVEGLEGLATLADLGGLRSVAADGRPRVLTADDEALLLDAWMEFVHAAAALDTIRRFYEDYYRFDPSRRDRDRHVRSFLLTFMAELALYERAGELVAAVGVNPNAAKFLNVPRPELGLPADGYARLREDLAGMSDFGRVVAGKRYLSWLAALHGADDEARADGYGWLWRDVLRRITLLEARRGVKVTAALQSDLAPLGRGVGRAVFPVQRTVAEWLGDTRVRRPGRYLIGHEALKPMRQALAPGDVLLSRKNWYLSNVGLPGFWPHAILYVGDGEALARAFDGDPDVLAWVREEGGREETFTAFLARRFPAAWAERSARLEGLGVVHDDPLVVIEAISEGVVQNGLAHAAGDYLVALRPQLSAAVKARAIARAFGYLGRPYDFDFDFATDHALVCSELVWRSYRPLDGLPGLELPTVRVAGRETLPANELGRLFVRERAKDAPQLSFVYFLDASEREQRAFPADEAAFVESVRRPKWDVAQR